MGATAGPCPAPQHAQDAALVLEAARAAGLRLQEAGHVALFAGGVVRDRLLGRRPRDVDLATSARPEQVRALWPRARGDGERFGVLELPARALVPHAPPEATIEIATFRTEGGYDDGRRPGWVRFGSLEQDAQRRDLTVNALYEDPRTGEIVDLVGGRADLAARRLCTVGEPARRLREDRLRVLRTVRLAAELDFTIEEATWEALVRCAPLTRSLAPQRVFEELGRLLCAPARVRGLELLRTSGMLALWLPEVAALEGVEQPPAYHPEGDCWEHTKRVLAHTGPQPPLALAWAALLHDVGKPPTFRRAERIRFDGHARVGAQMAERILERFGAPRALRQTVVELVRDHLQFIEIRRMREAKRRRFLLRPTAPLHLALHRADCLGSHGRLETWRWCVEQRARCEREQEERGSAPLVRGRDLLAAGYRPGPQLGAMLRALEEAQLEGEVTGRDDALAWLQARFGPPPGHGQPPSSQGREARRPAR